MYFLAPEYIQKYILVYIIYFLFQNFISLSLTVCNMYVKYMFLPCGSSFAFLRSFKQSHSRLCCCFEYLLWLGYIWSSHDWYSDQSMDWVHAAVQYTPLFTFTFIRLSDTFIRSDLETRSIISNILRLSPLFDSKLGHSDVKVNTETKFGLQMHISFHQWEDF